MVRTNAALRIPAAVAQSGDGAGRSWRRAIAPYARPDTRLGMIQLLNTGLPFLAIMTAMYYAMDRGILAALVLAPVGAALLVRLFMIQHDCGHGSFFASRRANDLIGRVLSVLTLTPYTFWRRRHAIHHATSGNLHRRGLGDVTTLTVREYLALSAPRRLAYRVYRHPLVMFGVGPAYLFLLRHRIPTGHPLRQWHEWLSILGTDAAIGGVAIVMAVLVGLKLFLLGYLPVILLAASVGVWLFYVQHQFEDTYWETPPAWDFEAAALEGSSFYDLPAALHWITGYIGFHHIHHLSSRVPNYRLRACYDANAQFHRARRLTLPGSLKCLRVALWDEERRTMVSFRTMRRQLRIIDG